MKYESGSVWVFNSGWQGFPGGVFRDKNLAETWIAKHKLTGTLTRYPLDEGAYDWAIEQGLFRPKKEKERTAEFIGKFSTASQDHFHYEDGVRE